MTNRHMVEDWVTAEENTLDHLVYEYNTNIPNTQLRSSCTNAETNMHQKKIFYVSWIELCLEKVNRQT